MLFPRKEGQKRNHLPLSKRCTPGAQMDLCFMEAQRVLRERKVAKKAAARPRDEDASDGAGSDSSKDFGRAGKVRRGGSATMGNSLEPIRQNGPAPRPVVDTSSSPVKIGAPILKVSDPWLTMLLDGVKTWEIRGSTCLKDPGTTGAPHSRSAHSRPRSRPRLSNTFRLATVYLERIGDSQKVIHGALDFQASIGPLSPAQWTNGRAQHCVDESVRPYGERTFAWQFVNPRWFSTPKPSNSGGGQVWAKQCAPVA